MILGGRLPQSSAVLAPSTPKHRGESVTSGSSAADCVDTRYYHDGMCIESGCPRHEPFEYVGLWAKHVRKPR